MVPPGLLKSCLLWRCDRLFRLVRTGATTSLTRTGNNLSLVTIPSGFEINNMGRKASDWPAIIWPHVRLVWPVVWCHRSEPFVPIAA